MRWTPTKKCKTSLLLNCNGRLFMTSTNKYSTFKIQNLPKEHFPVPFHRACNMHRASCLMRLMPDAQSNHFWGKCEQMNCYWMNVKRFSVRSFFYLCEWRWNSIRNRFNNVIDEDWRDTYTLHTYNVPDVRLFIRLIAFSVFRAVWIHSTKLNMIFIIFPYRI